MPRFLFAWIAFALVSTSDAEEGRPPRSLDRRIKIELFADSPQIVTPTGIDVDSYGRVWAIESNTHFPPAGYQGHPTDRVYVMTDSDGDGRCDKIITFTDGLTHAMSIAIKPPWLEAPESSKKSQQQASGGRKPPVTSVYVATRRAIYLLHDDDGDQTADRKRRIIHLDTTGDYPHNGLAGFAFDALGWMYFGFGENLGADYKIIGSDGTTLSGGGEGGNLYRCRPDGSKLKQWATGFWNPHASCVDAFGRLFTVDNDPHSRPPCRLLHIIEGGDYGYRYRTGPQGLHPFTSWNGEIPGTLPMVSGTGEAPSGIIAYESDGLPEDYIGNLLVTSWGDHRIDRFRLKPKGASFQSLPETIIQGGKNFRPVGLAVAPDGSLYCTDWVLRDYKVHGKGRVWRISGVNPPKRKVIDLTKITPNQPVGELKHLLVSPRLKVRRVTAIALKRTKSGVKHLISVAADRALTDRMRIEAEWACRSIPKNVMDNELFFSLRNRHRRRNRLGTDSFQRHMADVEDFVFFLKVGEEPRNLIDAFSEDSMTMDPFVISSVVSKTAQEIAEPRLSRLLHHKFNPYPRYRLALLLAARKKNPGFAVAVSQGLGDSSPAVRRAAVQWVAEEKLTKLRPQVEAILNDSTNSMTTELFLATLAALEMLDGIPPRDFDKTPASKYVLPLVKDGKRPPAVRAQALRLVDPLDPALDAKLFLSLLDSKDVALRTEAVRSLQHSLLKETGEMLRLLADDEKNDVHLRAEAVAGLGHQARQTEATRKFLLGLLDGANATLRSAALRSLRGAVGLDAGVREAVLVLGRGSRGLRAPLAGEIALALGKITAGLRRPLAQEEMAGGNAATGRRIFFHVHSAGCYKCHTVNGRGGRVGPDLSHIGRLNRKRLIESILEPSKEIAPQFTNWTFVMASGKTHSGMILGDTRDNIQRIGTAEGKVLVLKADEIEERHAQKTSVMPDKLAERMTAGEFRDLLAFLETLQ